MRPILRVWAKLFCGKIMAAIFAAFLSLSPAWATDVFAQNTKATQKETTSKVVLYLGGGEHSPWFHLGVLYAIEEYGIPVDSIVATSWGAWVGDLWARGVSPDEIQKMMLDATVAPYVGHDMSMEQAEKANVQEWPISSGGVPSLRKRYTVGLDSNGLTYTPRALRLDSESVQMSFARLRFQETLNRQRNGFAIPFSVQGCDDGANVRLYGNSNESVIASLPLLKAASTISKSSGELCPYYALPAEDNPNEVSVIVVADPLRDSTSGSVQSQLLRRSANAQLRNQPGLIIRPHAIADTSRNVWIQAGFSAMEQRRTSFGELTQRKVDYKTNRKAAAKPWFRFNLALDSLSPSSHDAISSYWDKSDTGLVAPRNLARRLEGNPTYDSIQFSMAPNGDLIVETSSHPTLDIAVGGFGSSAIGPNAYIEESLSFVDHVEMQLVLSGFYGVTSWGFTPHMEISKLWGVPWGFTLGYDLIKLRPLKSFYNTLDAGKRFEYEIRRDLNLTMYYGFDDHRTISAEFLFGYRIYELDTLVFDSHRTKTFPVSPMLHYSYRGSSETGWFRNDGLDLDVTTGFESVGYSSGIIDVIPIYWKILMDIDYAISPNQFLTLSAGAASGVEKYHEEGYGYKFPREFDNNALNLEYRLHARATPWSMEWANPDLSSHEYAMARASASVHGRFLGLWLFGAYLHDFEENSLSKLEADRFVLEPAIRFHYKSVDIYAGMNRIADVDHLGDFVKFSKYTYFIKVGNYEF